MFKEIIERLKTQFEILDEHFQREDFAFVTVDKKNAISIITHLRDYEKFTHLSLLTATDWIEDGKFQLTYLLNSPQLRLDLTVKVMIDRENATMTSAHHLWEQMATYQRELKEMFGIDFPGSPRLDEPFILEGWEDKPPYRRDFDSLEYSDNTYFPRPGRETHDTADYMRKKLFPNAPDNLGSKENGGEK
jgi:NADH-quinone oxidoreductase subunit C